MLFDPGPAPPQQIKQLFPEYRDSADGDSNELFMNHRMVANPAYDEWLRAKAEYDAAPPSLLAPADAPPPAPARPPHLDALTWDYISGRISDSDYKSRKLDQMEIWDVEERDTYQWPGFDAGAYALSDSNPDPDPLTGLPHSQENYATINKAAALEKEIGGSTYADKATGTPYKSAKYLPPAAVIAEMRASQPAPPADPILSRPTAEQMSRLQEIFDASAAIERLPDPILGRGGPATAPAATAAAASFGLPASPFQYDDFGIPISASTPAAAPSLLAPRTTTSRPRSVTSDPTIWSDPAIWGVGDIPAAAMASVIDPNDADTGDQANAPGMDDQLSPASQLAASIIFGAAGLGFPLTVAKGYNYFFGDQDPGEDYLGGFGIDPEGAFDALGGGQYLDDTADVVSINDIADYGAFTEGFGEGFDPGEFGGDEDGGYDGGFAE